MADWLRPVFARTKTPILGSISTLSADRQTSHCEDVNDAASDELCMSSRLKAASRVSSYINSRPETPPVQHADDFSNIPTPERVYHKPLIDQMAETLKVVMMTQNTLEAVPIQYNSTILYLLEAYQDMREQLIAQQELILKLNLKHTRDITEFESSALQWNNKEKALNAEVERLEVILSRTRGAMETVLLARSNSLIHGSEKASGSIDRDTDTFKEGRAARGHYEREAAAQRQDSSAPNQLFNEASQTHYHIDGISQSRNGSPAILTGFFQKTSPVPLPSRAMLSMASHCSMEESPHVPIPKPNVQYLIPFGSSSGITKSQLEALELLQADLHSGLAFESSASGIDSSSDAFTSHAVTTNSRHDLALDLTGEMSIPQTPIASKAKILRVRHSANNLRDRRGNGVSRSRPSIPKQTSFSFRPGDDSNVLARAEAQDMGERQDVEESLHQRDFEQQARISANSHSAISKIPSTRAVKYSHNRVGDLNAISRYNSSSSILTATRDTSERSSMNSSSSNSGQSRHPHLNRNTSSGSGSSEAVAAAARAYNAGQKGPSISLRPGIGSGSGSQSQDGDARRIKTQRNSDDSGREKKVD